MNPPQPPPQKRLLWGNPMRGNDARAWISNPIPRPVPPVQTAQGFPTGERPPPAGCSHQVPSRLLTVNTLRWAGRSRLPSSLGNTVRPHLPTRSGTAPSRGEVFLKPPKHVSFCAYKQSFVPTEAFIFGPRPSFSKRTRLILMSVLWVRQAQRGDRPAGCPPPPSSGAIPEAIIAEEPCPSLRLPP